MRGRNGRSRSESMFPWHSTIAASGNSVPTSGNAQIDAAHRQLLQWLASAPRDPQGRLADPAAMIKALPFKLSSQGAGMLLAICDMKGQPSRDEFERCVTMGEASSGYEEAPAARAPQKGRGLGHLMSSAGRAGAGAPGRSARGLGPGKGAGKGNRGGGTSRGAGPGLR